MGSVDDLDADKYREGDAPSRYWRGYIFSINGSRAKKQRERLRLLPYLPFPFISFHRIPIIPFFLFRTTYLCLYCATLSREEKDIFVVGNLAGSSLTLTFLNSLAACHVCKLLRCFRNLTPNFYIRKILTVSFSASNRLPAPTHLRMNASKQLFWDNFSTFSFNNKMKKIAAFALFLFILHHYLLKELGF